MGKQELRYKRLKVGHACFVCRNKKIKVCTYFDLFYFYCITNINFFFYSAMD